MLTGVLQQTLEQIFKLESSTQMMAQKILLHLSVVSSITVCCNMYTLWAIKHCHLYFYRASAVAASPVLATIGMSVCPSVRHTLTLCENDAS